MTWIQVIQKSALIQRLAHALNDGGFVYGVGSHGSSVAVSVAALSTIMKRPILLITAHIDAADDLVDEFMGCGIAASRFPALEWLPGESARSVDQLAERLRIVRLWQESRHRRPQHGIDNIIVAPIAALMQTVPTGDDLLLMMRRLQVGDHLDLAEFAGWLTEGGYNRVQSVESAGEFSIRGGIVDVFPPGAEPCRIDLFGDEIEAINAVDLDTMGSDRRLNHVEIVAASFESLQQQGSGASLLTLAPAGLITVLDDIGEVTEQAKSYFDRVADARSILPPKDLFRAALEHSHAVLELNQLMAGAPDESVVRLPVTPLPLFGESAAQAVQELVELAHSHQTIVLCQNSGEVSRMKELLAATGNIAPDIEITEQFLHRGFIWAGEPASTQQPLALVPYHELLHRYHTRRRTARLASSRSLDSFLDLEVGDYVVHRDHGIGKFLGLRTIKSSDHQPPEEFLTIEFAKSSRVNVPVAHIDLVQKYIGAFTGTPELSHIGGKRWQSQKESVGEAVRDLAAEMLRMQAVRESMPGIRYPNDTPWQKEFEAEFPYEETEDQATAINAVKRDMMRDRPMDRLICGDVGFGKTEIAIRAAFKAAEYGKQIAVLVPTTVLAEQHEFTFKERFADYPFKVESISRFKSTAQQQEIIDSLRKGQIDVIIGTHRLLSKDVKFADLGLVIIDEEQRFGVEHKQRLLQLRTEADVLTLSATPIPRTLHMAMLGLRDISSLTTAPLDRRAIVTEVLPYNRERIQMAINRELAREGQIFFVHNRVYDIESVADEVLKLVPNARIVIGHGQMAPRELEKVMLAFIRGHADILVCTTIIESGIDIPRANTMFVNDAHMFGLAELHQLRGRVGRYKHRAYCYLLLSPDKTISDVAMKRLRALEAFSMLGAGFKIALRDLEIRGAGNLLGAEQSGHIAAVGYEMYCQLLEQAVRELRNETSAPVIDTVVDLQITGLLPSAYIPSDQRRMDAYRRISRASTLDELTAVERDIVSAYGALPTNGDRLLRLAQVRIAAAQLAIASVRRHDQDIIFRTQDPLSLEARMRGIHGSLRLVGQPSDTGLAEVYFRPPPQFLEPDTLLAVLVKRLTSQQEIRTQPVAQIS